MAYETKPNTGALFKNDKQGNDKRPDYRGNLDVDGTEYELAAWLKEAKSGTKYMSLSVKPKGERRKSEDRPNDEAYSDSIPF